MLPINKEINNKEIKSYSMYVWKKYKKYFTEHSNKSNDRMEKMIILKKLGEI